MHISSLAGNALCAPLLTVQPEGKPRVKAVALHIVDVHLSTM